MAVLPEKVNRAWDERQGPVILTTVDASGNPNAIYATCVSKFDEETLVIADNYFHKTRQNIKAGSQGAVLFMTGHGDSFQVKGVLEYHQDGPVFEDMKKWNPSKHPGHAAAALKIREVFSGGENLLS